MFDKNERKTLISEKRMAYLISKMYYFGFL